MPYYSRIILNSFYNRLFPKLFRHNRRMPTMSPSSPSVTRAYSRFSVTFASFFISFKMFDQSSLHFSSRVKVFQNLVAKILSFTRGVRHAFKSLTLWLKSVFKAQISSQSTNYHSNTQNQFSNRKYNQLQISKTLFSIGYE